MFYQHNYLVELYVTQKNRYQTKLRGGKRKQTKEIRKEKMDG